MSNGSFVERAAQTIAAASGTQAARVALSSLLAASDGSTSADGSTSSDGSTSADAEQAPADGGRELSLGRASVLHAVSERCLGQTVRALRALSPKAQAGTAGQVLAAQAVRLGCEAWGWERQANGLKLLTQGGDAHTKEERRLLENGLRSLYHLLTRTDSRDRLRAIVGLCRQLPDAEEPDDETPPATVLSEAQAVALADMLFSRDPTYCGAVLTRLRAGKGLVRVTRALLGRKESVLTEFPEDEAGDDVQSGIQFDPARNAYVATEVAKVQSWQFHLRLRQLLDWELPGFFVARDELAGRLVEAAVDPDTGSPLVDSSAVEALVHALALAGRGEDEDLRALLDATIELQFSSRDGGDVPQDVAWQMTPRLMAGLFEVLGDGALRARLTAVADRERQLADNARAKKLRSLAPVLDSYSGIPQRHKRGHWAFVNLSNAGQTVTEMGREDGILPRSITVLEPGALGERYANAERVKLRFVLNDLLDINVLSDADYWKIVGAHGFPPDHELLSATRPILASGYLTIDHGKIVGLEDDGVMIPGKLPADLPPMLEVLQALGFDLDDDEVARSALALDWGAYVDWIGRSDLPNLPPGLSAAEMRAKLVASGPVERPALAVAWVRRALDDYSAAHPDADRASRVHAAAIETSAAFDGFCIINIGGRALALGDLPTDAEFVHESLGPYFVNKVLGP